METLTHEQQFTGPMPQFNEAEVAAGVDQLQAFANQSVESAPVAEQQLDPRLADLHQTWVNLAIMTMKWKDREAAQHVMEGATTLFVASAAGHVATLEQQRLLDKANEEDDEDDDASETAKQSRGRFSLAA